VLAAKAGIDGIEWGGDVHVPHGNVAVARAVRTLTVDAGLRISSYGSYYRAGESEKEGLSFADVLKTAKTLEAPCIRVWCGNKGSADADAEYRDAVCRDLDRIGELAGTEGVTVACEYHGHTLTDTLESAQTMFGALNNPNVFPYWQPPGGKTIEACIGELRTWLPTLANLHVFFWRDIGGKRERCPLIQGAELWQPTIQLAATTGRTHWALLEFFLNDSPDQFLQDAAVLRDWTKAANAARAGTGSPPVHKPGGASCASR